MSRIYRVDEPKVISETFEKEVVAINFASGSYYGMTKAALEIWPLLRQGASAETMVRHLASRYDAEPAGIAEAMGKFLASLLEHELIVETEEGEAAPGTGYPQNARRPWEPPELSVYDDMQDLLLLDPIHEVDETGWPARKPESNE
jgi:hypothetical protein